MIKHSTLQQNLATAHQHELLARAAHDQLVAEARATDPARFPVRFDTAVTVLSLAVMLVIVGAVLSQSLL